MLETKGRRTESIVGSATKGAPPVPEAVMLVEAALLQSVPAHAWLMPLLKAAAPELQLVPLLLV